MTPRLAILSFVLASALHSVPCGAAETAAASVVVPSAVVGEHFVPVHSSVRAGDGRTRIDLAVTLAVHNTSQTKSLVVTRVDYHDGAGRLVERRLDAPTVLAPLATLEIFVAKTDIRAGTGADFIVGWAADGAIAEPLVEAVMIGDFANQSYAFVSTGQRIAIVGTPAP